MKFIAKSLMTWMAVLCIGLTCAGSARADWFEQVMDSWISISVVDGEPALEQVVGQISRARELAIVFDRRVDSSRPVQAELLQAGSLSGLLDTISAENRLEFESIGETLVVVPHSRAHRIRTLIALRQQEFRQQSAGISLSQ
ncbi:MAG: hypothetical protein KDA78_16915, partial [Planctomycetaceae bacterium]|nr:hypothetical protein [Planctomycetaceae bacterium]